MKILVVEDEIALSDALKEILKRNQYNVDTVDNGEDGLEYALTGLYDCIILDIMLPIMYGLQVLKILRKRKISTPVMLLTAKSDIDDKITGLDCGADDYLTKPFVTGEFLARVRALTRRTGEVNVDTYEFHGLALNKNTYMLSFENQSVKLSLKEYQIMEMLIMNPNQIITKERFIEKIWGFDSDVEYNNIEVYISFLRKKIHSINSNAVIHTARGVGYYLEEK